MARPFVWCRILRKDRINVPVMNTDKLLQHNGMNQASLVVSNAYVIVQHRVAYISRSIARRIFE